MIHGSFWRIANLPGQPGRLERFFSKVDTTGRCWEWQASKNRNGYGRFHVEVAGQRKGFMAHRYAYELLVGPIPDGLVLDHLCRNRACVRPSHLEPVTNRENILRGESDAARHAVATHCPQGHPYDEANTEHWRNERRCITCRRINNRESMRRTRAKARAARSAG